jgi:hypothetical protein
MDTPACLCLLSPYCHIAANICKCLTVPATAQLCLLLLDSANYWLTVTCYFLTAHAIWKTSGLAFSGLRKNLRKNVKRTIKNSGAQLSHDLITFRIILSVTEKQRWLPVFMFLTFVERVCETLSCI